MGVSCMCCHSAIFNIWLLHPALRAACSGRMGTGLGATRRGGCCSLPSTLLVGPWSQPLWAQLSSFLNAGTQTGWLTLSRFLPPLRFCDSSICPSNTFDSISGLKPGWLSQKGHESVLAGYTVPWAKWLMQRPLKENERELLEMAWDAWMVDWI